MAASTTLLFQISSSTLVLRRRCILPASPSRVYVGFKALRCSFSSSPSSVAEENRSQDARAVSLLEKLRLKHLKHANPNPKSKPKPSKTPSSSKTEEKAQSPSVTSFEEMGLSGELMGVLDEMGIKVPTEVQCLGVPAIMRGESIVLASHTGSGKTLAYMLPLVQLLRRDEAEVGMQTKPKRPRAVILCPTRELSEQVFRVAKSVSHHARFRSTMIGGGSRMRPQEDALNHPIEMVVGTPGRLLEHINQGNMFYGDIKYVILDEADTMFDRGFGPDLRKFLNPLRNRASKSGDQGFQSVLVTATITKAVQKLLDEEFQGIVHIRTSTLHKKIASAFHDFIKLSGTENKLEALLQVLEPSLAKGNRVMVFCNTLDSSRAVDHFLNENQVSTVNYHGEVPAEQRVENLNKFKSDDSDCPTLVCTDLAARGLDLAVDHVIMFDFPLTPIDYLHRTGRTARMGAKGKVTSLVTKKDTNLASQIEDAIRRNESLEALTTYKEQLEERRKKQIEQKLKENGKIKMKTSSQKTTQTRAGHAMSPKTRSNVVRTAPKMPKINSQKNKQVKVSVASARKKQVSAPKTSATIASARKKQMSAPKTSASRSVKKVKGKTKVWKTEKAVASRLSVVGFKGKQNS